MAKWSAYKSSSTHTERLLAYKILLVFNIGMKHLFTTCFILNFPKLSFHLSFRKISSPPYEIRLFLLNIEIRILLLQCERDCNNNAKEIKYISYYITLKIKSEIMINSKANYFTTIKINNQILARSWKSISSRWKNITSLAASICVKQH